MKKNIKAFLFAILIPILFCSCNSPLNKKKPNNFYYTNELTKCLTLEKSYSVYVMETSFYRKKDLSNNHILIVKRFMSLLNKNNFIKKPKSLPKNPLYKIYFTFNNSKYVINVYNDRYLSIYPWDGAYEMDYIDMKGVYISNNLYNLCKFIIPRY